MPLSLTQLRTLALNLEGKAGASTTATDTEAGYWKRIAAASETISGTSTVANAVLSGYQLRAALALESTSGTNGVGENFTPDGFLKRIVDALEVRAGASYTGALTNRVLLASAAATFGGAPPDTTPDAFSFTPATDVALGSTQTSGTITVAGLGSGASAPVAVTGGTYSKNGGARTSADGVASNGDTFNLRHTASASNSTVTTTTLTIGGVSAGFTSTTLAYVAPPVDATPNAFSFTDATDVALSSTQTSNTITVGGMDGGASAAVSITGGTYSKNGGGYTSAGGTAANGDTFAVRHTSSGSNSTAVDTTLTIGGVSDTFTSTTLAAVGLPAAPTITWTSDNTVRDPLFTFSGLELGDVVTLTILNTTAGTTHGTDTNTVDALELGNGELTFAAMPTLAFGTAYSATATITRGGLTSAASNTVTQTIVALPATTWGAKSSFVTLSNGNLTATGTGGVGAEQPAIGSQAKTGKRYFEVFYASPRESFGKLGVGLAASLPANFSDPGNLADAVFFKANSALRHNGADLAYLTSWEGTTAATTIGIAVDSATKKVWVRLNGSWLGGGDPGSSTGGYVAAGLTTLYPLATAHNTDAFTLRRTSAEFTGSVPTGFLGWDD